MNLCGPMATPSLGGAKYIFAITDDYTRKSFVISITHKDDTFEEFQKFKAIRERETGMQIGWIHRQRGRI